MNCVLLAKMDQVFSRENKTLKKYWKIGKKYWKSQGKVREFCQSGKVGTLTVRDQSSIPHWGTEFHLFDLLLHKYWNWTVVKYLLEPCQGFPVGSESLHETGVALAMNTKMLS